MSKKLEFNKNSNLNYEKSRNENSRKESFKMDLFGKIENK